MVGRAAVRVPDEVLRFLSRLRSLGPGAAGLAAGLFFALAAFLFLKARVRDLESASRPVTVLAAARYLPAGTVLAPADVRPLVIPEKYAEPTAVGDLGMLEGLAARVPISPGEQVQANQFARPGEGPASLLEPGRRAYTLEVDPAEGVGGLLRPGHRVDLLVKTASPAGEAVRFLYQDLPVLAAGDRIAGTEEGAGEGGWGGYTHVTLSLSPDQAETLLFLEGRSTLKLLLRAPGDREPVELPLRTLEEVLAEVGTPAREGRRLRLLQPR